MISASVLDLAAGDHVVHFYDDDAHLVDVLASYLRGTLAVGGAGVIIAGRERLTKVRSALEAAGDDVAAAEADGRLILRDADETLALFESDGLIDPGRFEQAIGAVLGSAHAGGREVRVYGEMVARLWDRGAVPAAVELEGLWNEIGTRYPFALFCAYPARISSDAQWADSFSNVCASHTQILDGAPELICEVTRRFPAAPHAARLARRLVAASLERWGYEHLIDDALLVVGEFTANAAALGGSDFTCGVSRIDGRVRIEVGDTSPAVPVLREVDEQAVHGRGLRLVDAVAHAWGWISASTGKVVWAELADRS